jgi:hypothetical protein
MASLAKGKYAADITYGPVPHMRGHWLDRLAEIDADLEDMKRHGRMEAQPPTATTTGKRPALQHTVPARLPPGQPLELRFSSADDWGAVQLYYRHVNQAERWRQIEVPWRDGAYSATIPADYVHSPYPLQYYFVVLGTQVPGFGDDLSGTPYFVVRS